MLPKSLPMRGKKVDSMQRPQWKKTEKNQTINYQIFDFGTFSLNSCTLESFQKKNEFLAARFVTSGAIIEKSLFTDINHFQPSQLNPAVVAQRKCN